MAAERTVFIKVGAKVDGAVAGLRKVKSSVDDLTKADLKKPQAAFDGLSNKAALAGGAIALGIGKAISSFAEFDAQMSAVSAALPDAGAKMNDLRGLAVQLGSDTQFSATEAAQGITEMAKAGVAAEDILNGGLKGGLDLAAAGQLNVAQASEIAATALNQFNLKGRDVGHVADLYAAAAGKAQGSVQDIAGAMKYAGVTAAAMGISIEETTGVLGLFAAKGIIGEQAGTSFRGMLLSLTSPSMIAAGTMEELGINVYDASGKFVGMQGAAQILQEKLGPLDEATRNAALGQIFGNESMSAAIALYQAGGKGVADWTAKVNESGFASKQAAKLTDNLKGDIERLGGSLDTAFIQSGSSANDALRTLTQGLGGLVDVVSNVPAPLLLASAGLTALALTLPKGISVYKDFAGALDTMGLSMDKLSKKAPRLATGVSGLKGAFAGLAIAAAAGAITNALTTLADLNLDPQKLSKSSDALGELNKRMRETSDLGAPIVGTIDNFDQVLEATFNPGAGQNIDSFFASLNEGLGFQNVSDIQVAATRLGELDSALSGLVSSGQGDAASRLFDQMAAAAGRQGISVDDLKTKLPGYTAALSTAGNAADTAGGQMDGMSKDVKAVQTKAEDAKTALDDLRTELEGFGSPLAKQRGAQRDYQESVDNANAALKDQTDALAKQRLESLKIDPEKASKKQVKAAENWATAQIKAGKGLDIGTDAGRKNQEALDGIRDSTLKAASSTFDLTASQDLAAQAVQKGRDAFIKQATEMGLTKKQAGELADQMGLIPKDVATAISLSGVDTADTQLDKVTGKVTTLDGKSAKPTVAPKLNGAQMDIAEARLAKLARGRTAFISISAGLTSAASNLLGGISGIAGTIVRKHAATGGPITGPGTGTSDSIPAMLSNGEHVLTAAEVAAAGGHGAIYALRKAILTGGVQYRAQGGPVASSYRAAPPVRFSGPVIDYDRLASANARLAGPQLAVYSGQDALNAGRQLIRDWEWSVSQ